MVVESSGASRVPQVIRQSGQRDGSVSSASSVAPDRNGPCSLWARWRAIRIFVDDAAVDRLAEGDTRPHPK